MNRWYFISPVMIAGTLLFFKSPGTAPGSAATQLYGFAHLLFFTAIAWGLAGLSWVSKRPFRRQAFLIILVILVVGGAIEMIQPFFGRSANWKDLGIDVLGGLLALVFLVPSRRQLHRQFLMGAQSALIAMTAVIFYTPITTLWDMWQASRQFPVLSDFETGLEVQRWSNGTIEDSIVRHGKHSLNVYLDTQKYAGTKLIRSFGDWQGYSALSFSLYNPDDKILKMTISDAADSTTTDSTALS